MLFYRSLDCPKVNFGLLSIFAPWKGWRGTWKICFPVKNGFSVKNLLQAILYPKMMASLNSGCNVSLRASIHLCKFVRTSQCYQKYSRRFFYIYRKVSWKTVSPSESLFCGLTSISIDSSFFVTWLHFKVFTPYSQYFWLLCIYLVRPCNFVNVICNWVKVEFKRIK